MDEGGGGGAALTVDPFIPSPGSLLDQLFEVRVFAQKQVGLLKSAIKFDVVGPDGAASEVHFSEDGGQLGAQFASQVYENWFFTEGGTE